ncbi:MAG: PAS domain-containing protein [Verrucomicrobiaceae bacterium]|nr:PAS domain-containing protein [Verrucomicrobiaceae bacterium]
MSKISPSKKKPRSTPVTVDARWRTALEGAGDGMWDWDLKSGDVQYSAQWKSLLGYKPDEIQNDYREWEKRVHPEDLPGVLESIHAHLVSRNPTYAAEFRMRCKDGSWKWILARGMVTSRDAHGRPLHIIGTHTDISAWRLAQQRESDVLRMIMRGEVQQQVFDAIVRSVEASQPGLMCCLWLLDEKSGVLRISSGPSLPKSLRRRIDVMASKGDMPCCGLPMLTRERVITREINSDPEWKKCGAAFTKAGLASCWAEPVRSGSGTLLGTLACYHPHPHVPAVAEITAVEAATQLVALAVDHGAAVESLRQSEERYARALAGSTDGLWDWNILTDEAYLSPRWKEMLGYADHELPDKRQETFLNRLHPDDVSRVRRIREDHFKHDLPYQVEFRLRTKSHGYKWFIARGKAHRDAKGTPVHMTGTISDIDDRKRAEAELLKSQRFNQTVLDQTTALILVMDAMGRFTHVNRAVIDLLGYPEKKLLGRTPWEAGLLDPDEVPRSLERFQNLLRGKDNPPVVLRIHSRQGEVFHVEIQSSSLRHPDGSLDRIIITGTDITARLRLEQEVIRVAEEEQATIGHNLHDGVGQTLTGIYSLTQILETELQGSQKQSAARIGELIRQAVAEVRRMSHGLSPLSVRHRGLHGGLRLLAETVNTDFRIKTRCDIDPEVRLKDPEHESNLFRIAQEAVNNALRHGSPSLIQITLKKLSPGRAALIIKDDGGGIKRRASSSGNGIGLRVMGYRADLIGAELKIDSKPRTGVTITCRCSYGPKKVSKQAKKR